MFVSEKKSLLYMDLTSMKIPLALKIFCHSPNCIDLYWSWATAKMTASIWLI